MLDLFRFIIKDREAFFSSAQRSQIVWQILVREHELEDVPGSTNDNLQGRIVHTSGKENIKRNDIQT